MAMELILHRGFNVTDDALGVEQIDISLPDGRGYTLRSAGVKGETALILGQTSGPMCYMVFSPLNKDTVLIQTENTIVER